MIRRAGMMLSALAALAAISGAGANTGAEPPLTVAVLAHPDDELFMAPALASLARQGHRVRMVHATPGDAGPGVSGMAKGEALAATRRAEAECAGRALGAAEAVNLAFPDGRLHERMRVGSLVAALREQIAPAYMILTWGPDGGYGHADHRMVSALTTQVVQAMPAESRPKLLYVGIPAGRLPPVPAMAPWATTDPALLTESIAYAPADLAAATAAAQCHVTQLDEKTRAGMMALFDATMWRGKVHFRPGL